MLVSFLVSLPRRRRVLLVLPLYPLVFLLCFFNLDTLTSITSSKPLVTPATTTIITAYYKLRSKHSHEEFLDWMVQLLQTTDLLVIYTEEWLVPTLKTISNGSRSEANTKYVLVNISDTMVAKRYSLEAWKNQQSLDKEIESHKSLETYWVWNEKAEMVRQVASENPFRTEFFFWADIGYLRTAGHKHRGKNWIRRTTFPRECITMLVVDAFLGDETAVDQDGLSQTDFANPKWRLAGGIWGGGLSEVLDWHSAYYSTMDRYVREGRFAGNDQAVMATTCVEHPSLCCMISAPPDFWNSWFWLDPWLAALVDAPIYSFRRPPPS